MTKRNPGFQIASLLLRLVSASLLLILSASSVADENKILDIREDEAPDDCLADIPQVRVTVNNVGAGGILTVELYNDPDNFLNKKGRERRVRVPASEGQQQVCFSIDGEGVYAVATYHDVDGNRKLKRRWNKMPAEPFGLSQNPKLKFGFPKFRNSAFETSGLGADISIDLQAP